MGSSYSPNITVVFSYAYHGRIPKLRQADAQCCSIQPIASHRFSATSGARPHATLANTLEITPHELATKISYLLTGSPPDSVLRGLANSGEITNPAVLSQQIDRLLATPRAREVMVRFFRESYGYDVFGNFAYPGFFLSGIDTNGLQSAMIDELDNFFASEIITQDTTFSQLMTSRRAQISNGSLAQIYGVSTGSVTLPGERAGFLNRAAMLTKRTGVRASPIKRGLVVLENVLCSSVGMPPPNAPTALPDLGTQVLSTREVAHRGHADCELCEFLGVSDADWK